MTVADYPEGGPFLLASGGWDRICATLFQDLGTERFAVSLKQFLKHCCAFESMVITRYPAGGPPISLFQDLDDVQAAISVQFYATGPYLLDPLYQACREPVEPGAYRLSDLVSESFFRSEYYRTFYRKISISDEVGLLIRQNAKNWIIVSLARRIRQPRFTTEDLVNVNAIFQTVSAAVQKNWFGFDELIDPEADEILEDRLQTFGSDVLTPREAEIVRLVLQGHSTPSAAAYLGISEGTVKVHRHHAYSKLGIASQAELFSLATRHFVSKQT